MQVEVCQTCGDEFTYSSSTATAPRSCMACSEYAGLVAIAQALAQIFAPVESG